MEALILRRNYPVPVTFADLRRAYGRAKQFAPVRAFYGQTGRMTWAFMLKSATGATDDVYAVVDGREVHVARLHGPASEHTEPSCMPLGLMGDESWMLAGGIIDLEVKADEQGYWERPHEVRLDLQTRAPSLASIDAVVQRSLIEAEVRRGH
jgi:hypothetical protein